MAGSGETVTHRQLDEGSNRLAQHFFRLGLRRGDGIALFLENPPHMIITGGVNVYPQETENTLILHPKVADVAVFGVPNEEFGEEVKAVIEQVDWSDASAELAEELLAFCGEQLAAVKCPRSLDFDAQLPRHPTGKLYKRLLEDRYCKGHPTRIV